MAAREMVSLRLDPELAEWATAYAERRGVSRSDLLENAIRYFKGECDRGLPELRERRAREARPASGDCVCPVLEAPDGGKPIRGFKQSCPVHGFGDASQDERRAAFNAAGAARGAFFRTLKQPDTAKKRGE